jgi:hypothetical protein
VGGLPGLRYAIGAFLDADADQWRWFVVGLDSLQQQQYYDASRNLYASEALAFKAGRVALTQGSRESHKGDAGLICATGGSNGR